MPLSAIATTRRKASWPPFVMMHMASPIVHLTHDVPGAS